MYYIILYIILYKINYCALFIKRTVTRFMQIHKERTMHYITMTNKTDSKQISLPKVSCIKLTTIKKTGEKNHN